MPGILVRFSKITSTLSHSGGDGYGIISVVDENGGEQLWQPPLNGIGIALYQSAYSENSSVTLTQSAGICRMTSVW